MSFSILVLLLLSVFNQDFLKDDSKEDYEKIAKEICDCSENYRNNVAGIANLDESKIEEGTAEMEKAITLVNSQMLHLAKNSSCIKLLELKYPNIDINNPDNEVFKPYLEEHCPSYLELITRSKTHDYDSTGIAKSGRIFMKVEPLISMTPEEIVDEYCDCTSGFEKEMIAFNNSVIDKKNGKEIEEYPYLDLVKYQGGLCHMLLDGRISKFSGIPALEDQLARIAKDKCIVAKMTWVDGDKKY